MYKLLLCWRYLLTRYLALACIISVMLGVATLIVVNSVMSGFSTKLKDRLHALLSDVVIESEGLNGFADPEGKMRRIRESPAGDRIAAMSPTLEVFAMLQYPFRGELSTRPVHLIGIDPKSRAGIGGFAEYLHFQKDRPNPTFDLPEEGKRRLEQHEQFERRRRLLMMQESAASSAAPGDPPPPEPPPDTVKEPVGVILGHALAHFRLKTTDPANPIQDVEVLHPGDEVIITTVSGQKLAPVYDRFAICDYFRSEMSEYDANYVFVPLDYLQHLRTMEDRVTSIQIRLEDYRDAKEVVAILQGLFPLEAGYHVQTWEDKQGPLLAAIAVERGLLNVLLFLIICVAGFGILAIFAMIVVEKTRDIGILKALGASNGGIMKIFLGYGLLLGVVGAGLGTALGLAITININWLETRLANITGQDIFPRDVYYFDKIPTDVQPWSVFLVNVGAIGIAVLFSVLPALRAALLQPVRALRYE